MARITVEDCIKFVNGNAFELVVLASTRARDLADGASPLIKRENHKNPVLALREIACEAVSIDTLREKTIAYHQIYPANGDDSIF